MSGQKAIFITGGASGIGRAVAEYFSARGWYVGLADVNEAGLQETASLLASGRSSIHYLDVRKRGDWETALAAFWQKSGGRLDVLFNNAGVGKGGRLASTFIEDDDLVVDVNIKGVIYGAKAGFPYLDKTPGSCLLNTSSAAGIYGAAGLSVYAASKFAVRGLTEALEAEWAEHGIKVRSLMPAFIDTPILDGIATGSNQTIRNTVSAAGLEISPVSLVAEAAWAAVHKDALHTRVGKSAHRMWFVARWIPAMLRRKAKSTLKARPNI